MVCVRLEDLGSFFIGRELWWYQGSQCDLIFTLPPSPSTSLSLPPCLLQTVVVSYNEDVEVGRCVSKMLNIQCTWSWEVRKREMCDLAAR